MGRERTAWLLIAAAVLYSTWMLEVPLGSPLPLNSSYASELGSPSAPHRWFFRGGDLLAGLLVVAWAVAARRTVLGANRRLRIPLLLFGLATVVDALCPMSCAPSMDDACRVRENAGEVPWTHMVHSYSSSIASISLWIVMWTMVSARPWRHSFTGVLNRLLWLLAGAYTLATGWLLWDVFQVEILLEVPEETTIGISQRVGLALGSLWIAVTGLRALRAKDASGRDQPT